MTTKTPTHEIVELDRETGEEISLLATGTAAQMSRHLHEATEDEDYVDGTHEWPWLRVQPFQGWE